MSKDFRASQIETSKLIASGGIAGTSVGLAIYSGTIASNREGGVSDSAIFNDVGSDVFLFISGSKNLTSFNRENVTLFGGDIVISGTLYAERQVIEVDGQIDGDMIVTGSLFVEPDANSTKSIAFRKADGTDIFVVDSTNSQVEMTGRVGINDTTPDAILDVVGGTSAGVGTLKIEHGEDTTNAIYVTADNLSTGKGLWINSDSNSTGTRDLVLFQNDNTAAVNTTVLHVKNDAIAATNTVVIESTAAETNPLLELKNSNTATDKPPTLSFNRSDTSAEADDMSLGKIEFRGSDSGNNDTAYVTIDALASDITDGVEGGLLRIRAMSEGSDGSANNWLLLSLGGEDVNAGKVAEVVVNEQGKNIDFRVESDGDAHAIFVDSSVNSVGIGTSTPINKLDLNGDMGITGSVRFKEQSAPSAGTNEAVLYAKDVSGVTKLFTKQSDGLEVGPLGAGGSLDDGYDTPPGGGTKGPGLGAIITVDDQPVQLKVAGASKTALAITGSVIIGSGSDGKLPAMAGPDVNFFVSGSIGSKDTAVKGTSVFGGDAFVSGSLGINTVTVTTDGKIGIGMTNPSYKLSVGGNAEFGEYLYHRGDTDTFIQFADDAIGITAGGEQLITISEAGQDIVQIGDGGDVDFQVRTNGDDNTLFVQGSSDRIGIGTNAPSSIVHIKESEPTLTIQRESNANNSSILFMGQAGATANMVHMASTNDLVFSTHDGVDQEEILRLGSHFGSDNRQVIMLSGSGMHVGAMQPKESTDINFFVSGSFMSRGTATKGTAVFGGDLVSSGGFYTGRVSSIEDGNTYVDLAQNVVEIGAGNTVQVQIKEGEVSPGSDVNFFVSGSIDSIGTSERGTSAFGGDVAVSGSVYNSSHVPTAGKFQRHVKNNNFTINTALESFFPGSDGESGGTGFNVSHAFMAPFSGSLRKIQFRAQNAASEFVFRFYKFPASIPGTPTAGDQVGFFSGSGGGYSGHQGIEFDIEKSEQRVKGGAKNSITPSGIFSFDPGDLLAISYQKIAGSNPNKVNTVLHLDYDTTSFIE